MTVISFPHRPGVNDNEETETFVLCANCRHPVILVVVTDGVPVFRCGVCRNDLTSGIVDLLNNEEPPDAS